MGAAILTNRGSDEGIRACATSIPIWRRILASIEKAVPNPLWLGSDCYEYRARAPRDIGSTDLLAKRDANSIWTSRTKWNLVWDQETVTKVDSCTHFHFYDFFDRYPCGQVDLPFVLFERLHHFHHKALLLSGPLADSVDIGKTRGRSGVGNSELLRLPGRAFCLAELK